MRRGVIALALVASAAASSRAGVEVTVGERGLDVRAARAPLAEVLDGLARKTKMKVVYEGARPHALVTVELKERTPAQAVLGVLEGLGLNYALVMNAAGTEVETLIFPSGGAAGGGPTAASSERARPSKGPPPNVPDEQPDMILAEEVELMRQPEPADPAPEPSKPSSPPILAPLNPTVVFPTSPFAPAAPATPAPSPAPAPKATPSPNIAS
jgi:hypothetical protein